MEFTRQAGVAVILVTGTLWLQSAGMAFLIHWARTFIARGIKGLGPWMSVVLMIRFTTAMVVLHILQILRLLAMVTLSYPKPSGSCGQYRALLAC